MASELPSAGLTPQLSFSDIIHPLPPSPNESQQVPDSPEPIDSHELEDIRRKVLEMGFGPDGDLIQGKQHATPRERDLAKMVLRLTEAALPVPSQLHAQAETIAQLIQQRDMLLHRMEEDQCRWQAEKESFARVAEVLIRKRRETGVTPDEDQQTSINSLNFDNRALRQRLQDAQQRLGSLEGDLASLKPALLLQSPPAGGSRRSYHRRAPTAAHLDEDRSPLLPSAAIVTAPPLPPPVPSPYYKPRPGAAFSPVPPTTSHRPHPSSISADARSEHILLAAKRLGRERTMNVHMHLPPGSTSNEVGILSTPRTPKRGRTGGATGPATTRTPRGNITYPGQVLQYATTSAQRRTPFQPFPPPSGPSGSKSALPIHGSPLRQSAQSTPGGVENLLNAARVLSDQDQDEDVDMSPTPQFDNQEVDTEPERSHGPSKSKRRRIDFGSRTGEELGKARSMLELLADQAAVFSSQGSAGPSGQPPGSPTRVTRSSRTKNADIRIGPAESRLSPPSPTPLPRAVNPPPRVIRSPLLFTPRQSSPPAPNIMANAADTSHPGSIPSVGAASIQSPPTIPPNTDISSVISSNVAPVISSDPSHFSANHHPPPTPPNPVPSMSAASFSPVTPDVTSTQSTALQFHAINRDVPTEIPPDPNLDRKTQDRGSGKGKGKAVPRSPSPSSVTAPPIPRVPHTLPPAMSRVPLPPLPSKLNAASTAQKKGYDLRGGSRKPQTPDPTFQQASPSATLAPPISLSSDGPSRSPSAPVQIDNTPTATLHSPSDTSIDPATALIPALAQYLPGLISNNNDKSGDGNGNNLSDSEILQQLQLALASQPGYDPTRPDPLTQLIAQLTNGSNTKKRPRSATPSGSDAGSASGTPGPFVRGRPLVPGGSRTLTADGVNRLSTEASQPPKRTRSPYVKWSPEEDELLAKAVAKYGQKWDFVQKELPSRGYHQVRQRWLRKLGPLDHKPDLAGLQTNTNLTPFTEERLAPEPGIMDSCRSAMILEPGPTPGRMAPLSISMPSSDHSLSMGGMVVVVEGFGTT